MGEKYNANTVKGRKTNGVGKSMCIEFLDFCFLSDYKKTRIYKIPEETFPLDEYVILDLDIGGEQITIKRNRKQAERPIIVRAGKVTVFEKLTDAKSYLMELIYSKLDGKEVPSFRNLLSVLMRDEKSEFANILKTHDIATRIPDDLRAHLYFLGLSLDDYTKVLKTIKEIDSVTSASSKVQNELTVNNTKKMSDVKAELNDLEGELLQLENAIEVFKTNDVYNSLEKELVELENLLDQLRQRQKVLKKEHDKIKRLPKPEEIDDSEIELVYNQFKDNLGTAVVKSLGEVLKFKNRVEEFQRLLVNQKAKELEAKIRENAEQIRILDDEYAKKIQLIDQRGILKDLKMSLRIYESKKDSFAHTEFLFRQYEQYDKKKKQLKIQKAQEILEIDSEIEKKKDILKSFNATISEIHMAIMGNRECSFDIETKDNTKAKNPISISLRIFDDGSHSVDRTKVFIYDIALLFNELTRMNHPLILIHDNIFDVDQDTLVQSLNYLYKQEKLFSDFQYILTLNRDKIENEERLKLIDMDINDHEVVVFTKEKKFLKRTIRKSKMFLQVVE